MCVSDVDISIFKAKTIVFLNIAYFFSFVVKKHYFISFSFFLALSYYPLTHVCVCVCSFMSQSLTAIFEHIR